MLVVTNASNRPIRNVAAAIEVDGLFGGRLANVVGTLRSEYTASDATDNSFTPATSVGPELELLQAGVEIVWEVGPDLRPTDLDNRNDW